VTGAAGLPVEYEPRLLEEAVLFVMRSRPDEAAFRAERDGLYRIAEPERREARFAACHAAWFARLGLDAPVLRALRDEPAVLARTARCLVVRARARAEEGVEVYGARPGPPEPGDRPTLVLGLCPETFAEPERLGTLLRGALARAAALVQAASGGAPATAAAEGRRLPAPRRRERDAADSAGEADGDGRRPGPDPVARARAAGGGP
jgi:hypothetical protein